MERRTVRTPKEDGRSVAKHAVLGLLLERPSYPYQLRDRLQQRLGPAWTVNSGQLSKIIETLAKDQLIRRLDQAGDDVSDRRKVFTITDDGVTEFQRWFDQDIEVPLPRRPLLVQITFAGAERLQDALAKIDAYERACAGRLEQLMQIYQDVPVDGALLRVDRLLLRLNLSADVAHLEGELSWARHAREMISWLLTRDAVWPSSPDSSTIHWTPENLARKALFARIARAEQDTRSAGEDQGDG
jgi:DNA-binding PadR family transcriptional regulator